MCQGLARNQSLSHLDLSRNTIGDQGLQALVKFLPSSGITDLCLENCGITGAGAGNLADLVAQAKRLKQLDVSTNILLDAGLAKLAPALERTSSLEVS